MALSIQTNVSALQTQRNQVNANSYLQFPAMQRLSSARTVIHSGDDTAATLTLSNRNKDNTADFSQGTNSTIRGSAQIEEANGSLAAIGQMLDRMKALAAESASGTSVVDRNEINQEYEQLQTEIDRWAGKAGLGDANGKPNILISIPDMAPTGSSNGNSNALNFAFTLDATSSGLKIDSTNIASSSDASNALEALDNASSVIKNGRTELSNGQDLFGDALKQVREKAASFNAAIDKAGELDTSIARSSISLSKTSLNAGISPLAQANSAMQLVNNLLK